MTVPYPSRAGFIRCKTTTPDVLIEIVECWKTSEHLDSGSWLDLHIHSFGGDIHYVIFHYKLQDDAEQTPEAFDAVIFGALREHLGQDPQGRPKDVWWSIDAPLYVA